MKQVNRLKLFVALIIPMLLIPIISFGYAHFTDSVVQRYRLHVAGPQIEVKDYKILAPCLWKRLIKVSPPKDHLPTDTITISSKVFPCWFMWIGFVLHNQGCLPANVSVEYEVNDPHGVWKWFIHKEYFYGPYAEKEFENIKPKIWDNCRWWKMPPPCVPPEKPPITLNPCEKMVLWIKLKFKPPFCWKCCIFSIQIAIKIRGELPEPSELSSWAWSTP